MNTINFSEEAAALVQMLSIWSMPTRQKAKYGTIKHNSVRSVSTIFGTLNQVAIYKRSMNNRFGTWFDLVSLEVSHPTFGLLYSLKFTEPPISESDVNWYDGDISHLLHTAKFKSYGDLFDQANPTSRFRHELKE